MISERMKHLLLEAAKCFEDSYSPFNGEWLSDHKVTLEECMELSEMIGLILRGVALSDEQTQAAVLIQSVLK
jgi:hypothetical protein